MSLHRGEKESDLDHRRGGLPRWMKGKRQDGEDEIMEREGLLEAYKFAFFFINCLHGTER